MNSKEQRDLEDELKNYIKALVKMEIDKAKQAKKAKKTSCKIQDLLKFMNSYEKAQKGKIGAK